MRLHKDELSGNYSQTRAKTQKQLNNLPQKIRSRLLAEIRLLEDNP